MLEIICKHLVNSMWTINNYAKTLGFKLGLITILWFDSVMDQFKLFLHSLSRRDVEELLGDAQHDRLEVSRGGANNSAKGDNSYIQVTM